MIRIRSIGATLALSALVLALGGCIKFEQKLVVLPDGSGKLAILVGVKPIEGMGPMKTEKPKLEDVDDIDDQLRGYTAISKPKHWTKDGWEFSEFAVYFDDINEFKILDNEKSTGDGGMAEDATRKVLMSYKYEAAGDGHKLTVHNGMTAQIGDIDGSMGDVPPEMRSQVDAMLSMMLAEFRMVEAYTLPGAITDAGDGFEAKERTASSVVTVEQMKSAKARAKLAKRGTRTITCGATSMGADEIRAFKDEHARAKAEWAEMKEAARREADK